MRAPVRRLGNFSGGYHPQADTLQIGIEAGDDLDLSIEHGRIVLVPVKQHPRAGWADAAKRIAEAGDDSLVWPEFGNSGDDASKW